MKSTKTIFVVALAALMLVAFTACNQTPTWGDNEVANVTVVSADKFYAGSTEKTGNAVVTVERVGGKTTENVAAKIEITGNSIVPGTNAAKVSYGEEGTKASTWMTTVEALSVTELEIKYTEPTGPIGSKDELDVDAVYGIYSDGTKTGNIIASVSSDFNEDKTAIVFTLSSTYNYSSETVSASVDVEFKEDPAPEVKGIAVYYAVNGEDATPTAPTTTYLKDEIVVSVWTIDSSNGKIEDVTSKVTAINGTSFVANKTVDDTTYSATIAYEGYVKTISIPAGNDSVTDVTAVTVNPEKAKDMTAGHKFVADDFVATYTTLSGKEIASGVTLAVVEVSSGVGQSIPSSNPPATVNVQVSAKYTVKGASTATVEYFTVPVTVVTN